MNLYLKSNSPVVEVGPDYAYSFISAGFNLRNWLLVAYEEDYYKFQSKHDSAMFFYARPDDIEWRKS